jgi:[acyl-carrier-protein] S-malonyltransferase
MDPITILCPGQGAQFVGMGKAWFEASPEARIVFEQADAALGTRLGGPLSTLCFEGPADRLNRTDISQPAIYVTSIACWRGLLAERKASESDIPIAAAAGLSLGEYSALHIAGAFSFLDGLELVSLRGRAMQDAAEAVPGGSGMLALIGADESQAQEIAGSAAQGQVLVCANFNAPGQVVLSGHTEALARAAALAAETGLRSAVLPVAGAFHSPLMAPAAERLQEALSGMEIRKMRCPVASNVTAGPHQNEETGTMAESVRRLLVEQLTSPVRWAESCRWLLNNAPASGGIHELAPGTTLAGLMRRIDRSVKVTPHDQPLPPPHA